MVKADIRIELKHGVADPEGENTRKALELLGFKGIKSVKTVKLFEVEMDAEPEEAKEAAEVASRAKGENRARNRRQPCPVRSGAKSTAARPRPSASPSAAMPARATICRASTWPVGTCPV
ncbi:MAG TPA: phosphoribosylformylglycinamidine synthase subunit PurS [Methanomassiliicoccaceae archaeon]|nr:phosphoribosylformylglycinamidine synthase subunit PurS [Methanomassiliicoccaceae archaeon]